MLVGGFKYFLFSPLIFFRWGWNHQPEWTWIVGPSYKTPQDEVSFRFCWGACGRGVSWLLCPDLNAANKRATLGWFFGSCMAIILPSGMISNEWEYDFFLAAHSREIPFWTNQYNGIGSNGNLRLSLVSSRDSGISSYPSKVTWKKDIKWWTTSVANVLGKHATWTSCPC